MAYKIIESSSTKCSECNGNADPSEQSHIHGGPGSGYREGSSLDCTNGCGVTFDEPSLNPYASRRVSEAEDSTPA